MDGNGRLFVAVGKRLHCLDPKTGNIIWKTSIKGKWCYLKIEPEALFVATNGFLQSVDKITGKINYTTSITGFSYDITSMVVTPNIIYVGNNGKVKAISRQDGTLLKDWTNNLPGKGYVEVSLALHDNVISAGISGSVVAINLSNAVTARDTKFKILSVFNLYLLTIIGINCFPYVEKSRNFNCWI
jgi:outer membrane protein assembly factor BamB